MIRGTTPTFTMTIRKASVDLSKADHVYVTIRQDETLITKSGDDLVVEENQVACWLTQEESLRLAEGNAELQINWTYNSSDNTVRRGATKVRNITIDKQLLQKVIS